MHILAPASISLLRNRLAALLLASTDLTLLLHGLVLVDRLAHPIRLVLAGFTGVWYLGAFQLLEPVALRRVLGPWRLKNRYSLVDNTNQRPYTVKIGKSCLGEERITRR